MNYLDGPNVVTKVIIRDRQEDQSWGRRCDNGSRGYSHAVMDQKMWAASRRRKWLGMDSPFDYPKPLQVSKTPKGMLLCWHFELGLVRLMFNV